MIRIAYRSGGGRGVYELSGSVEGFEHQKHVDREIAIDLGSGVRFRTGAVLTNQGGKPRIKLLDATIHVHRQVAAAMMLPKPTRSDIDPNSMMIAAGVYRISSIDCPSFHVDGGLLWLDVVEIHAKFGTGEEVIRTSDRMPRLAAMVAQADMLPAELAESVVAWKKSAWSTGPLQAEAEQGVTRICKASVSYGDVVDMANHLESQDSFPILASLSASAGIPEPVSGYWEEPKAVKKRLQKLKQALVGVRGPTSDKFRRTVQRNYGSRCLACGIRLPKISTGQRAGVEAAHILPHARYEGDEADNGIMLCRLHHWAFDEGLLLITYANGTYRTKFNEAVREQIDEASLAILARDLPPNGTIPTDRLPRKVSHRPNPLYLSMRTAALTLT